jgi:predicted outer membrane repeat protein
MSTRSGRRLRAAIATIGGLALAATLLAAAPAAAASPTACRVKNLDTGVTKASLQKAHDAAKAGHRLTVRGTCAGITTLRKSLTITGIQTATSGTPILDAKRKGTVVRTTYSQSVDRKITLRNLTIRRGAAPQGSGGGIANGMAAGTLVLRNVIVRGNTAFSGGGVWTYGDLILGGSTSIRGNTATGGGGGVVVSLGRVTLNGNSTIRGNTAVQDGGGGVWMGQGRTLTLNGSSSIRDNSATIGGGIYSDGTVTMQRSSSVRGNTASRFAGGVLNGWYGTLRMRGSSSITDNTASPEGGGGLASEGVLDGVVCAPDGGANVRQNSPYDCWIMKKPADAGTGLVPWVR